MRHVWPLDMEFNSRNIQKDNKPELARAYVLFQTFENVYGPMDSLKRGTAFKDLDKPEYRKKP